MSSYGEDGLQAERTTLAWRRTGLTTVAAVCATTHLISDEPYPLALLALFAAFLVLLIGHSSRQRLPLFRAALEQHPRTEHMHSAAPLAMASALTVCFGLLAGAALMTHL